MTRESNRIIGDILEINSDIINKRIESKAPKFITNLKEKYYRYRLNKIIKSFKKKLILDKFNLEELFSYILTYYEGKYKCIQKIRQFTNNNDKNDIYADIVVNEDNSSTISSYRYNITISNDKPNMTITASEYCIDGSVNTMNYKVVNLYTDNFKVNTNNNMITVLNNSLVDVLTSFLNEYLERFNNNKGYMKEVSE